MKKSLRAIDRAQHGDALLRRFGLKYSIRIHNHSNESIKVTIRPKKPMIVVNKVQIARMLGFDFANNFDDCEDQVFTISPRTSKKIKVDSHDIYVTIDIDSKKLWDWRKVSCAYDIHIQDDHLKELFEHNVIAANP